MTHSRERGLHAVMVLLLSVSLIGWWSSPTTAQSNPGLLPSPLPASLNPTTSAWAGLDAGLTSLAPATNFLAAEIVDDQCQPVHAVTPNRRLALASTFKLYVLGELARQVAAGHARWDEELAIQDRLKSLPSGGMLYEPAGTRHTLRYFAERMIADSDNTATDHLIDYLGRERVEAAQVAFGHEAPEMNTPFLTTHELFAFKIAVSPERIDSYLAASDHDQRRILANEVDPIPLSETYWGDWVGPKRIESLEWFASATEICRALATLHTMSSEPGLEPIKAILSLNRGGALDPAIWPYAGFKGGYEAGVYNMTWLLQRADGRFFVLTAGFNDPVNYVDQGTVGALMLHAANLLARTP